MGVFATDTFTRFWDNVDIKEGTGQHHESSSLAQLLLACSQAWNRCNIWKAAAQWESYEIWNRLNLESTLVVKGVRVLKKTEQTWPLKEKTQGSR